jgi:hypothetical protein
MSDEGGSAAEEIYATISRRKKRTIPGTGQDGYLCDTTLNDKEKEEHTGDYSTELYEESVKLRTRECDGQEMQENKEDEEEDRQISSWSTFSDETLDELSLRFPANLSGLSEQYKDISTDNEDTANYNVEGLIKPSHIRHLVLNNQYHS